MATRLAPGVIEIDTMLGGWERTTAGYLMEGPEPVLVEVGSATSVETVKHELDQLGIGPTDLAAIAVTHIHLDHAGGVGDLALAFPNATIYVHPNGARHLADPSKLMASAERVFGPLLDRLYGRLKPTEASRIHALEDLEQIKLGHGRTLTTIDSPGHAKHHLALHDSESGIMFVGDAVGVRLPEVGVVRPATPPPDFDYEKSVHSLHRFMERDPSGIAFAHYGLVSNSQEILSESEKMLNRWETVAERAFRAGTDVEQALSNAFDHELHAAPEQYQERVQALNGTHSNSQGLQRWLESECGHAWLAQSTLLDHAD